MTMPRCGYRTKNRFTILTGTTKRARLCVCSSCGSDRIDSTLFILLVSSWMTKRVYKIEFSAFLLQEHVNNPNQNSQKWSQANAVSYCVARWHAWNKVSLLLQFICEATGNYHWNWDNKKKKMKRRKGRGNSSEKNESKPKNNITSHAALVAGTPLNPFRWNEIVQRQSFYSSFSSRVKETETALTIGDLKAADGPRRGRSDKAGWFHVYIHWLSPPITKSEHIDLWLSMINFWCSSSFHQHSK